MSEQLELMGAVNGAKHEVASSRETQADTGSLPAVTVGRLSALQPGRAPLVDFPTNNSGELVPARTVIGLDLAHVGCDVALVFEDGDHTRPVIVGVLQEWDATPPPKLKPMVAPRVEVQHDDDALLLTAAKEITLQCGKASITLTSAGKLLLRGAYLLSRSSGVNRIKGGSVQIN